MKIQLKIIGIIFIGLGALIAAFGLFALSLGVLNSLGFVELGQGQSLGSAMSVFFILCFPALCIYQTGVYIFRGRPGGRLFGLLISGILFVALNGALLFTKDWPTAASFALAVVHALLIVVGLYTMILLSTRRSAEYFG